MYNNICNTKQKINNIYQPSKALWCMSISIDNKYLFVGNGSIRVWDILNGIQLAIYGRYKKQVFKVQEYEINEYDIDNNDNDIAINHDINNFNDFKDEKEEYQYLQNNTSKTINNNILNHNNNNKRLLISCSSDGECNVWINIIIQI